MPIQLVTQPRGSKLCGQAVVAMILGVDLATSVRHFSHRRGTKLVDLRKVLRANGFTVGRVVLTRFGAPYPPMAILRQSRKGRRNWHWLLWADGAVYDPSTCPHVDGSSITSFAEVSRK